MLTLTFRFDIGYLHLIALIECSTTSNLMDIVSEKLIVTNVLHLSYNNPLF